MILVAVELGPKVIELAEQIGVLNQSALDLTFGVNDAGHVLLLKIGFLALLSFFLLQG